MTLLEIAEELSEKARVEEFGKDRIELLKILNRIFGEHITIDNTKIFSTPSSSCAYYTIEDITFSRIGDYLNICKVNGNNALYVDALEYPKIYSITDIAQHKIHIERVRNFKPEPKLITENKI